MFARELVTFLQRGRLCELWGEVIYLTEERPSSEPGIVIGHDDPSRPRVVRP